MDNGSFPNDMSSLKGQLVICYLKCYTTKYLPKTNNAPLKTKTRGVLEINAKDNNAKDGHLIIQGIYHTDFALPR